MPNHLPDDIPNEDNLAPTTDISFVVHPSTWEFIRERLDAGGRVLDVGCGNGTFLWNVEHHTSSKGYGLDPSPTRARMAATMISNGRIVKADGARAPFPSKCFDVIACIQVIEHIVDRPGFIARLYEMLKPGGLLVVTSVRRANLRWYYLHNEQGEIVLNRDHVYEFRSLGEFNKLIVSGRADERFSIIRSFEYQIRFPVVDFVFRRIQRVFRGSSVRAFPSSRIGIAMRKATRVPIPGYFSTDVVAVRKGPLSASRIDALGNAASS